VPHLIGVLSINRPRVKITSLIFGGVGWASLAVLRRRRWPAYLGDGGAEPTACLCDLCLSGRACAIELGLSTAQAHLFVFWFALCRTITPQSAGGVSIARRDDLARTGLKVALTQWHLALAFISFLGHGRQIPTFYCGSQTPQLALFWAAARVALGSAIALVRSDRQRGALPNGFALCAGLMVVFSGPWLATSCWFY